MRAMSTVIGAWARIMRHASQTGYEEQQRSWTPGIWKTGAGANASDGRDIGIKIVGISEEIKAHLLTITKRWK
jgi:hypothetical protein